METTDTKEAATASNEAAAASEKNEVNEDVEEKEKDAPKNDEAFEDIEEEDVPDDFFDDFSNQDFMAGLDIVDEDDWEEDNKSKSKSKEGKRKQRSKIDHVENFRRSPPGKAKNRSRSCEKNPSKSTHSSGSYNRRSKSLNRRSRSHGDGRKSKSHKRKSKSPIRYRRLKRTPETSDNYDDFDIRRDPEKTRRDIQRDKLKCANDKKQKLITEKLRVVETGLVPPGMEMEFDLDDVKLKPNGDKTSDLRRSRSIGDDIRDLRRRIRSFKNRSSPDGKYSKPKTHSKSPSSKSTLVRKISPIRDPVIPHVEKKSRRSTDRRSESPRRRSKGRHSPVRRSPLRRSPLRRSPRHYRLSPTYERMRLDRYSPSYRKRVRERSLSPLRSRRRSRSRSPRRKKYTEDSARKSFLQEIAEKLNETRPPLMHHLQMPMQPHMNFGPGGPGPLPAPVPPPNQAPVPMQFFQNATYDQQFFIGNQQPTIPSNNIHIPSMQAIGPPIQHSQPSGALNLPSIPIAQPSLQSPSTNIPLKLNSQITQIPKNFGKKDEPKGDENKILEKLFEEKKITLSEFLSVSAKPEAHSRSPAQLQEKIKVISRCQDAVKIIGNEKKFTGKLVVPKYSQVSKVKHASPLEHLQRINLSYTSDSKKTKTFSSRINGLLLKLGIPTAIIDLDPSDESSDEMEVEVISSGSVVKTPEKKSEVVNNYNKMFPPNCLMKMVQTDPVTCADCEKRKQTTYATHGVQCGETPKMVSISTQVTEEDINPKLKKQSLASLTPAQLLATSRDTGGDDKVGSFGPDKFRDFERNPERNYNRPLRYSPPNSRGFMDGPHPLHVRGTIEAPSPFMSNFQQSNRPLPPFGGDRFRNPNDRYPFPLDVDDRYGYNNRF